MKNLSIKNLVRGGFSLSLLILCVVAAVALFTQKNINNSVVNVVEISQPAILKSYHLSNEIEKAASALGLYMLSNNAEYQQQYLEQLAKVETELEELKQMDAIRPTRHYRSVNR